MFHCDSGSPEKLPCVCCSPTRRGFLAFAGAGAATALVVPAFSPPAFGQEKTTDVIDIHHHILPPKYIAVARERLLSFAPNYASVLDWTPARSIEQMDQNGVRTAMTSLSVPGTWFGKAEEARSLARMSNEYAAQMVRDYPGRFGVLASLSLPDVEGSLKEIEYAFDTLKVDGIAMLTSYGTKWPGDEAFAPVFEELDRRGATVYFHPTSADCCSLLIKDIPAPAIEYMFDTTRAITSLLFSGSLSRYKKTNFVFSHAGGATAPIFDRIARMANIDKETAKKIPEGPIAAMKRLYFDTATSTAPENLGGIMRLAGDRKILFGSDYPFVPIQPTLVGLSKFGFTPEQMANIRHGNAQDLFPRLRA